VKKIGIYSSLMSVLFVQLISTGCSSDDAHADSPCPTSFNSLEVKVLDSVSGEEIKTAELIVAGNIYDKEKNEYAEGEVSFIYDSDFESYGFRYSGDGIEIDQKDVTIYTLDRLYDSNVTKPKNFGCTSLETTIYLCPKGTACR
jgi:hypothetical protein